jgi:ElaB/YqjD/DUF883 family membrane-anchored ribosome-binding protein
MSDTNNESRETADLLDADGRVIPPRGNCGALKRVEEYIHAEPVKAALIAIGIGYIVGRLRLIV